MLKRLAILVAASWLTASCGGGDGGKDGGGAAGTSGSNDGGGTAGTRGGNDAGAAAGASGGNDAGGTSGTITVGQVCDSTGMAFCNRVMACGDGAYADCFNAFKGSCCTNAATCSDAQTGMTAARLSAYETACDAAFQAEACADIGVGTVPAACSAP
jgi:hypothetical protein